MKKKHFGYDLAQVPDNTIRIIKNSNGKITHDDFALEELDFNQEEFDDAVVPVTRKDAISGYHQNKELVDSDIHLTKAQKKLVDPFIPYAASLDPDHMFEHVQLGVYDDGGDGRFVTATYKDGTTTPMTNAAFIGDSYGALGMFVPFNANHNAILDVATLFTDIAARNCENKKICGGYTKK